MTKFTTKTKIMALALTTCSLLAFTTDAQAQEAINSNASVVVQNAFTLVENNALDFGTIVAFGDGTGAGAAATLAIDTAGGATITNGGGATDDRIVELIAGNQADFTISAAAPSTVMNVTIPSADITLSCTVGCTGTPPDFTVGTFVDDTTGGPSGTVTTDGAGGATFNMGATLTTDAAALIAYDCLLYTSPSPRDS